MKPPTKRQIEVMEAINDLTLLHGYPPTLQEIAKSHGVALSSAQGAVDGLIRKRMVDREEGVQRSLKVVWEPMAKDAPVYLQNASLEQLCQQMEKHGYEVER